MQEGAGHLGRTEQLEQAFEQNYGRVQYAYVEFFSEHMADCSREFGGDLQQLLLIAIIGQVVLVGYNRNGIDLNDPLPAISASRLADVSGIPRETVRRKLRILEKRGLIMRNAEQSWTLKVDSGAAVARNVLGALERRAFKRLARMCAEFEKVLYPHAPHLGGVPVSSADKYRRENAAMADAGK